MKWRKDGDRWLGRTEMDTTASARPSPAIAGFWHWTGPSGGGGCSGLARAKKIAEADVAKFERDAKAAFAFCGI